MGHFFEEMNMGNVFQVFSIDVRFQSTLFLKHDILNVKSACLIKNDIFRVEMTKIDNFFE